MNGLNNFDETDKEYSHKGDEL